jgi:hypothetical protein
VLCATGGGAYKFEKDFRTVGICYLKIRNWCLLCSVFKNKAVFPARIFLRLAPLLRQRKCILVTDFDLGHFKHLYGMTDWIAHDIWLYLLVYDCAAKLQWKGDIANGSEQSGVNGSWLPLRLVIPASLWLCCKTAVERGHRKWQWTVRCERVLTSSHFSALHLLGLWASLSLPGPLFSQTPVLASR